MTGSPDTATIADRIEDGPVRLVGLARDAARRGDRDEARDHLAEATGQVSALITELAGSPQLDVLRAAMADAPTAPDPDPARAATAEGAFDFALDQTLAIYDHLVAALRRAGPVS